MDTKWLTTLPGVGPATAEQIVATLRRKVTKFALMVSPGQEGPAHTPQASSTDGAILEDAYQALVSVGHGPSEARDRLDKIVRSGKAFKSVEEVLLAIYQNQ